MVSPDNTGRQYLSLTQVDPPATQEKSPKLTIQEADLDDDTYALFIVRLVQFWDATEYEAASFLSLFHAFFVWLITIALQLTIAVTLFRHVEHIERHWEDSYFRKQYDNMGMQEVANLFYKAIDQNDELDASKDIVQKCKLAVGAHYGFYYMMVFVWLVKIFGEFEKCRYLQRHIYHLGLADKKLLDDKGDVLVGLRSSFQKFILILIAPIVKSVIALLVMYAGVKFILLQTDESKIVMKALCMNFVVDIDTALMNILTKHGKNMVKRFRMETSKTPHSKAWDNGVGSFMFILFVCAGLYLFLRTQFFFGNLMYFRQACNAYNGQFPIVDEAETRRLGINVFDWEL